MILLKLQAFSIENSKIQEAHTLFKLLKDWDNASHSQNNNNWTYFSSSNSLCITYNNQILSYHQMQYRETQPKKLFTLFDFLFWSFKLAKLLTYLFKQIYSFFREIYQNSKRNKSFEGKKNSFRQRIQLWEKIPILFWECAIFKKIPQRGYYFYEIVKKFGNFGIWKFSISGINQFLELKIIII